MAHLSLRQRAPLIRDALGLPKLQHSTIRSYYLKFGVKSVRPDYGYFKTQNEKRQLREKQMEFARLLGTLIMTRAYDEILYIDETSFHLWQKRASSWLRTGMKLHLVGGRGPSMTVIGAIS
jgi:hypothetical protein